MKLQAYLDREDLSYSEFARRAGTPHARTIERIAKGQKMPGDRMLRSILSASFGEVTPNDFYDVPTAPSADETPTDQAVAA
ncbi:helix-turn-helix domain-containing protein [Rhizorhabdus sp.]|uniref:helix-turn-helix domain-containing protein n=1 Tax=Rhizorhabdus sp. TaxID=1968843 RepID=UPI0035AE4C75